MIKRILVGLGGTPFAAIATQRAIELRVVDGKGSAPQAPRYTSLENLQSANTLDDVIFARG
jgi:hypothetical protein